MKEEFLKEEWNNLKDIQKNYESFEEYKEFMNETAKQYLELGKKVSAFKGLLEDFIDTLDGEYINYKENEYIDFYWGNLTCTIIQKDNKLYLSKYVEIWNDGICTCEYNSFNIEECLN